MSGVGYFEQFAFVGPALMELSLEAGDAALVTEARTGAVHHPREVWLPINRTWLRLDGSWISGWRDDRHFSFRPSWLSRIKIRSAASGWLRMRGLPL